MKLLSTLCLIFCIANSAVTATNFFSFVAENKMYSAALVGAGGFLVSQYYKNFYYSIYATKQSKITVQLKGNLYNPKIKADVQGTVTINSIKDNQVNKDEEKQENRNSEKKKVFGSEYRIISIFLVCV